MNDTLGRPLRDLRISVTDRCNFRCRYCMPVEVFGPDYQFLDRAEVLTFEEIVRVTRASVALGVRKIRLTGGEPLLRRDVTRLVAQLKAIEGVEDLALTTNATLLARHAGALQAAGLDRVTVSLDALDEEVFARMNGVGAKVSRVLAGVEAALAAGLPVKVNAVIQRGVNEQEVLPLVRWGRESGVTVRFIEYMDVGESNGWRMGEVLTAREIVDLVAAEMPVEPADSRYRGEVAGRWQFADGKGEFGVISSVSKPFCRDCTRLRLSAEGRLFTCLFASEGTEIKSLLRSGASAKELQAALAGVWQQRTDRYSEERGQGSKKKAEMSYLGG
ncbi:GTP 3',8-cyclase MoaA [Roseibacillus ishigakijimensis]|uniref:GTP 3',8-cyclase n=1 Tax=Roseibacillus ishigakijimensis TaxID=454146 RepID=A0A934VLT1_9BACT|nr:GTP 3',8-cyclase MoaA [Roseibacillus ishigakijimensis]MBK1833567.1 GTP 3',8-cyclase MoaA [Roseibacillus ishigakijimensis]